MNLIITLLMIPNQIICADSYKWLTACRDNMFDAIITDPPYGVTTDNDDYIATGWLADAYRVLKDDAALFMCVGQATLREFWNAAESVGFSWMNTVVWWHRNSLSRQKKRFAVQYDPLLYFSKGNFVHLIDQVRVPYKSQERLKYACNNAKSKNWRPNELGAMCPDVWEIPAITTTASNGNDVPLGHKWQKPLELMDRMVRSTCKEGALMLDPFCGSGTSLMAAKRNDVKYIGIDIDVNNVELSRDRLNGEIKILRGRKVRGNMKDLFDD